VVFRIWAARAAKAKDRDLERVADRVRAVKELGLETCATLGMLKVGQAERLRDAGLAYYDHNLDTSRESYGRIITTRDDGDRLETLERVRAAGIRVSCGGIVGMGESRRAHCPAREPRSTSGKRTDQRSGAGRRHAAARIAMPKAQVRLSAGRNRMDDGVQALCFLAGANSVFYGEKLLTTSNPAQDRDRLLFERLGLKPAL